MLLLLRQQADFVLIVCPASICLQWRTEMQRRFGLRFEVMTRQFIAYRRQERGFGVNPWKTGSFFVVSHALLRDEDYLVGLRDWLDPSEAGHSRGKARKGEPSAARVCAGSLLILDEAHHVAASTFHSVVDRCPARYRLGLTATPDREDGLTALLDLFLGAPLVTVTHDELVAAGVLTVPDIHSVETDFTYLYTGAEDYAPMLAAVASDPARNALIVGHVVEEARAGHVCLVLSGRIDHCHTLAAAIEAEGVSAAVLTGEVKRAVRKELLDRARAGELAVIVATSLADEGLDLPRLARVFLAYPGRARGRTVQRLGRLMRPHAEKTDAALFDFVDRKVPLLRRHHLERRKLYAEVLGVPASKLGMRRGAA